MREARTTKPGSGASDDMRNRTGPTLLIADDDRKGVRAIANVASGLGLGFVTATAESRQDGAGTGRRHR